MSQLSLFRRLEILEERVEALEFLPSRIDALTLQIVQFREDVRAEISATRNALREELRRGDEEARRHMRTLQEEVIAGIGSIQASLPPR